PCTSYNFLNDSWRNTGYDYRNLGGISMCDYYMNGKWYRFSGAAGDVMPTDCVPEYHCGAAVPIWMNGTHPKESDGITEVEVCGHWDGKCCNQRSSVNVTLCPGGYYLYQLHSPFVFHFAFCTRKRHTTCEELCLPALPEVILTNISFPCEGVFHIIFHMQIVKNYLNAVMSTIKRLSDEKGAYARNAVLQTTEKLVSTLVPSTNKTAVNETILLNSLEARLIGGSEKTNILLLKSKANEMKINLTSIAKNNEVAFMSYTEMEQLLSVEFFENGNQSEMISDVITATLPKTKTTNLSEPVNFTLKHTKSHLENGLLTCVYWKETVWSVEGCTATYSNESHTVCSCTHLSTFALIMQMDKEHEVDDLLAFINKIAVSINLVCLALAILTFSFCTWNPKINNTARLNLSICLFLAHFIFVLGSSQTENKILCSAIAVILHYLFLGSFMWMYLEAIQIFLLVKSLKKVKVIQRQGLHYGYLLLIGYSTPAIIVGVSVGVFPNGYGNEKKCWLNNDNGFRWSFLGPVCYILVTSVLLFVSTVWNLLTVLAHMKSEISKIRDTRLMVFKTLAQFVILGCSWILAFVQESPMFFYMFLFLNSQQGTFIFLVHCLLNKEVIYFHGLSYLVYL
ncbi:AGRE1 protein, partial [Atractosteus spatula]|nr:AGRE1 protein [Atractosteus spatula]